MAGPILRLTRLRVVLVMMLAIAGLQAAVPIHAPFERQEGSAFSSTTIDVGLASTRRADVETAVAQPLPATLPSLLTPILALPVLALAHVHSVHAEPRGPPPRAHPARVPDSTAPPRT